MIQHVVQPLLALRLGGQEIVLLLVLGVLLFGRSLPSFGRTLGKTISEFRKVADGHEDDGEGPAPNNVPVPRGPILPPQLSAPIFEEPAQPPNV